MRRGSIAGLALLSASVSGCGASPPLPPTLTHAFLADGWADDGIDCESDGVLDLEPDGTWSTYGAAGTWALQGRRLTMVQTERGGDIDEPVVLLQPPERSSGAVEVISRDAVRVIWTDGRVSQMRRCTDAELGPSA